MEKNLVTDRRGNRDGKSDKEDHGASLKKQQTASSSQHLTTITRNAQQNAPNCCFFAAHTKLFTFHEYISPENKYAQIKDDRFCISLAMTDDPI